MKKLIICIAVVLIASTMAGCSSSHLKANMTAIKNVYTSIKSMSGTAVVREGNSNDTVLFTFVKPNEFLEWYSTKNRVIVYNGSAELIQDNSGKKILNEKPFNPFDYGKILNGGKAYVSGNSVIVENNLGKVWLNEKYLPEKIEWNRGISVKIVKLNINGYGDRKIIEDFMGKSKKEKANRLVSINEAEREVGFELVIPTYTNNCRFVGAIVSNVSSSKVVTLYYGDMSNSNLLTLVEAKNFSVLNEVCGMEKKSETTVNGVKVYVGRALNRWNAYEFSKDGLAIIVYGNLSPQEMLKVVESMI